ncbi:MAG TPA: hypothetical protein PLB81_02645 [Deltaproteobacteria bacterium]|mgnify:CR=1 FL=1|nr:hypothetical protein [Deltaproteobacteria bacterium]
MRISVHDDVLIGGMPEGHLARSIEAAVGFGRALKTAYEEALKLKFPDHEADVQVEVKLYGGFGSGFEVDVSGHPGEVTDEPEIVRDLLAGVREMTFRAWLAGSRLP